MKIVAGESVDFGIVEVLRMDGFEVTAIAEADPSISDDEVLRFALLEDCLLMTEDKDFGELVVRLRKPNRGVLLLRLSGLSPILKYSLVRELFRQNFEKMLDSFCVFEPGKLRIRKTK